MAEWRGVHVNDSDMLRMQQEAIRRVRQMQQRARRSVEGEPIDVEYQPVPAAPPPPSPPPPPAQPSPAEPAPAENNVPGEAPPHEGPSPGTPSSFPGNQRAAGSPFSGTGPFAGLGSLGEKLGGLFGGASSGRHGSIFDELLGEDSPIARVLDALHIDSERLLIIGLLLVLLNEKADRTLLLALVYLLF